MLIDFGVTMATNFDRLFFFFFFNFSTFLKFKENPEIQDGYRLPIMM